MKTAKEMYDFCSNNGYTVEKPSVLERCCNGMAEILESDEDVLICFMGVHNYVSIFSYDGFYLYAVTNKRLIILMSTITGCKHRDFPNERISHVDYTAGIAFAKLQIDISDLGKLIIGMQEISAKDIARKLQELFFSPHCEIPSQNTSFSSADELIKLKALLDNGVLTEDEFYTQKKKVLESEPSSTNTKTQPQSTSCVTNYQTVTSSNHAIEKGTNDAHSADGTQNTDSAWEAHNRNKIWWIIVIAAIIIACIIVQSDSEQQFEKTNDGKCDICGDSSNWTFDGHEYCDRHAEDKLEDDFYKNYGG